MASFPYLTNIMNIPRKQHRSLPISMNLPGITVPTIQICMTGGGMANTVAGKTVENGSKRRGSGDTEKGNQFELKEAMSRSMSVPKLAKLRSSNNCSPQLNASVCGEPSSVKISPMSGKKTWEGGRKTPASKIVGPLTNGGYLRQSLGSQMTLGGSPSKSSFASSTATYDLESQLLSSQRTVSKLDFLSLLSLYDRYFTKAIKVSGPLEPVLTRIKAGYEGLIEDLMDRNNQHEIKLKQQIQLCEQYREEIKRITEHNRDLEEKVMKLRKENEDLRSNCQELEANNAKNAIKHRRASTLTFPGFPPSLEEYAKLVSDLEGYKEKSETLTKEMTAMKGREKKLTLVVRAVKRRESWGELSVEKREDEEPLIARGPELCRRVPAVPRLSLISTKLDRDFSSTSSPTTPVPITSPRSSDISVHLRDA